MRRCAWAENMYDDYVRYHDEEWGVPVHDDRKHFEFLVLEGAQAGLSWSTVLKKREGYRTAFAGFVPEKVALFDEERIQELIQDPAIIRNQLKIRGTVANARQFLKVVNEFGSFDSYIWSFVNNAPIVSHRSPDEPARATSRESDLLSKDLKKRGFKFVGSTIIYAHMQACGLVNDHSIDCFRFKELVD